MVFDVKHFRVLPRGSARQYAAQGPPRGTYLRKGQGLHVGHTKPAVRAKFSPGGACARFGDGQLPTWPSKCNEMQENKGYASMYL